MDGVNASHDLDFAENRSTYEEPKRLLDDFYSVVFPRSPIPPPLYWTGCPPDEMPGDEEVTTMGGESTDMSDVFNITTLKPTKDNNNPDSGSSAESTNSSEDESSPVPLSIVVAVGCALIFLNLLICAGMYYHRRRLRKLRERPPPTGNGNDVSDNRNNSDRNVNRDNTPPGATNLVHSSDASLPKVANMNHKPVAEAAPAYTALAKPGATPQGPGGYTYSALSQKSSSPMHTHNHIHFADQVSQKGPPSEDGSQSSSSKGHAPSSERPPSGANQVPKMDTRVKHVPRGTQQVSSNNAITIV